MSTKPKPTEGPWRPGKAWGSVVADHPVPGVGGSDDVDYYGGHLIAESVAPQNVPIIAAAPELLEALEGLLAKVECGTALQCPLCDKARQAIAKAQGVAQ